MKRRRFVALVSSMLLIMSMVVCIAVPSFAASFELAPFPEDSHVDTLPYPSIPSEVNDSIPLDSQPPLKSGEEDYPVIKAYWSYNGVFQLAYVGVSSESQVYAYSNSGYLVVVVTDSAYSYFTSNGSSWSGYNSGSDVAMSCYYLISSDVDIGLKDSEELFYSAPLPPKPPLVAATEGANLGAVMTQVIAILPIGLGCLVGYLGLRKALAFCRRILSGA